MDLLQDYSDDDEDEQEEEKQEAKAPPPPATKAKKLLSLTTLLPAHILDRLEKDNNDDSSIEEDEPTIKDKQVPKKKNNKVLDASEMSDFLQELSTVKKKVPSLLSSKKADANTPSLPTKKNEKPAAVASSSSRLGQAFLSSTTTVVESKKQSSTDVVVDIHGTKQAAHHHQQSARIKQTSLPPVPPMVQRPRVSAAPQIGQWNVAPAPPMPITTTATPAVPYPTPAQQPSNNSNSNKKKTINPAKSKKRRMEDMLRQGNFHAIGEDVLDGSIDAPQNLPTSHFVAAATTKASRNPDDPTTKVKVVPVSLYQTSAGAARGSGKQASKNQVSHLLQSAAALQNARAEQGNHSATDRQKMYRANARSKYGW